MKIGLLTSSRADFGIYYPLVKGLFNDAFFQLEIIAFGTHLSEKFGYTLKEIEKQGFEVKHKIDTLPQGDNPKDIAKAIGSTIQSFAEFWSQNTFDIVLTLGDRYEMFAAVSAGSPFNVKFAHIHGGETTLGAIDNAYRHSISLMSEYLFVTTNEYKDRGIEIIQNSEKVFNVGALSIDNLKNQKLFSKEEFFLEFGINIDKPYILSTFHPETVSYSNNEKYIDELLATFNLLKDKYQIIITMPNSDTMGLMIRNKIEQFGKNKEQIIIVESLGMKGYLSCMKYCNCLMGNTSSGFVEAAFFPKWVINLGNRQKGRIRTPNIIDCKVDQEKILEKILQIENSDPICSINVYGNGDAANKIIEKLKQIHNAG